MKYILDTNIIIYWWKGSKSIEEKIVQNKFNSISITFTVLSELFYGAYKSEKVEKNLSKIYDFISKVNVIDSDLLICEKFGIIKSDTRKKGIVIDDADIFIAAASLCHDLTLVTNNTKHFITIEGIKLENWLL